MTFTCEWKYDGERAQVLLFHALHKETKYHNMQIHYMEDGTLKVYSRNLEDNTAKYPDIALTLPLVSLFDTQLYKD